MRRSILSASLVGAFLVALPAHAATWAFVASPENPGVNGQFTVDVYFDAEGESVNALQGSVRYDTDMLELKDVSDAGGAITLWAKSPVAALAQTGAVDFSGITPGGLPRNQGRLFTLTFSAKGTGSTRIQLAESLALLNDGLGTPVANANALPLDIAVSENGSSTPAVVDTEPPLAFAPEIIRNEALYDGAWTVVFSTQDKESAIDHYEVNEGDGFVRAENPYLLKRQTGFVRVQVRAIDRFGNVQEEEISKVLSVDAKTGAWGILGATVLALGAFGLWRMVRRNKGKKIA